MKNICLMVLAGLVLAGCARNRERPSQVPVYRAEQSQGKPQPQPPQKTEVPPQSRPEPPGPRAAASPGPTVVRTSARSADQPAEVIVPSGQIGRWSFDADDFSEPQAGALVDRTGAELVPSFDGRALLMRGPGPARAVYASTNRSGVPLISRKEGGIRFWYKPFWFTDGAGPGNWVRLFEWGNLKLSISPAGNLFTVETPGPGGTSVTNLIAQIGFGKRILPSDPNLYWHEFIWNYNAEWSWFILDGEWIKNTLDARGVGRAWDGAGDVQNNLSIGSDAAGNYPARGMIEEFETYSSPITPLESQVFLGRDFLAARALESPAALELRWRNVTESTNGWVKIQRRKLGASSWVTMTNIARVSRFVDWSVEPGERYEYLAGERYLLGGVRARPVEKRGKALLIVDRTMAQNLEPDLEQLRRDMIGDGWRVVRRDAPRHDDQNWTRNTNAIVELKRWIVSELGAESGSSSPMIFLIGHVPVPYSGAAAEDGHSLPPWNEENHFGAWGADSYYGDLSVEWTDSQARYTNTFFPRLQNLPGDGKFDRNIFGPDCFMQAGVGRVDFANMTATFRGVSEADLLRRYLAKDHRFREGQIEVPARVLAAQYFGGFFHPRGDSSYANAVRISSRLTEPESEGDLFREPAGALWGLQSGFGGHNFLHGPPRQVFSTFFANETTEPKAEFMILSGSYFGDWDHPDNLLRAAIGGVRFGLGALYGFEIDWHFERMGFGEPIGSGLVQTSQAPLRLGRQSSKSVRTIALMGDPSLRFPVVPVPESCNATRQSGGVRLDWPAASGAEAGYFVYRAEGGWDGEFRRLNEAAVTGPGYLDGSAPNGSLIYALRRAELSVTGSGSFTNLSQARFAVIER